MSSRRVARLAEAIRETVSSAVLFSLRDPRIKNVTVIRAEVTPDLRGAKVYVSIMGSERDKALSLQGLDSSRGFLQSKIADRIQTRYTPVLKFVLDEKATDQVSEAARILDELAAERVASGETYADFERSTARSEEPIAEVGDDDDDVVEEPDSDDEVAES
jgi:ribosome-binding factor A